MSVTAQDSRPRLTRLERLSRLTEASGVGPLMRRVPRWRNVASLVYHRLGDPTGTPWDRSVFEATAEEFDAQMAFVSREFDVISPEDVGDVLRSRRPGRHVLITFDDGYRDSYEHGFTALRRHGLTATFFITTGFLDDNLVAWWDEIGWMVHTTACSQADLREWLDAPLALGEGNADRTVLALTGLYKTLPDEATGTFLDELGERLGTGRRDPVDDVWMTWDMVRDMRRHGMTIGGHTVTHPVLARLSAARQREEILGCKARLEEALGEPLRFFSYPVGGRDAFDETTRRILREAGIDLAFSFYGSRGRHGGFDPLDVRRRGVARSAGMAAFRVALTLPGVFPNR